MEQCIPVIYTQMVLDILQHCLTYMFIHCSQNVGLLAQT